MGRNKAFNEIESIEKAKAIFHQKGYEATSMQDLVDTLGLSRSSIYDTFGDKHNLYCKSLELYSQENAITLSAQAEIVENSLDYIHYVFNIILEQIKKDKEKKGCFIVNSVVEFGDSNSDVNKIIQYNNQVFEKMLEKLIIKAQQDRQISKDKNAKLLSKFLFTTINGIRVSAKANSSVKELKAVADFALSQLH